MSYIRKNQIPFWATITLATVMMTFITMCVMIGNRFTHNIAALHALNLLNSVLSSQLRPVDPLMTLVSGVPGITEFDRDLCIDRSVMSLTKARGAVGLQLAAICPAVSISLSELESCDGQIECLMAGIIAYQSDKQEIANKLWRRANAGEGFYLMYLHLPIEDSWRTEFVRIAVEIELDNSDFRWDYALRLLGNGAPIDETVDAFARLIELEPSGTYRELMSRGFISYLRADAAVSVESFSHAYALAKGDTEKELALVWSGRSYLYLGKAPLLAAKFFEEAMRIRPGMWPSVELGLAYEEAGLGAFAHAAFLDARERYPNHTIPAWFLARHLWRHGQCDEAVAILRGVMQDIQVKSTVAEWRRVVADICPAAENVDP